MRFTTEVSLPVREITISHETEILLLGSCFAQNMGQRLATYKFRVDVNPFGILYNPLSISKALRYILSGKPFDETSPELFNYNGMWHSYMHHGDFSRQKKSDAVDAINLRITKANAAIRQLNVLMITFGTAYVYRRTEDDMVVGNCHKLPGTNFNRSLLTVNEIVEDMSGVIEQLTTASESLKILFTVSPIRHLRDGAHGNQISKATLLLAIEELCRLFPKNTVYFPSYEIMLDELRDYRFYSDDMTHPSSVAQEYLWECFSKSYFTPATIQLNEEISAIVRGLEHRPFDVASQGYKDFLSKILLKIASIQKKYPYFDFENEISKCNILLKE